MTLKFLLPEPILTSNCFLCSMSIYAIFRFEIVLKLFGVHRSFGIWWYLPWFQRYLQFVYVHLLQISASIGQRIEFTLYRFTLEETKKKTSTREHNFPCDNNIIIRDGSKQHVVSVSGIKTIAMPVPLHLYTQKDLDLSVPIKNAF